MVAHLPASNKYQHTIAYKFPLYSTLTNFKSGLFTRLSLLILGFAPRTLYVGIVLHEVSLVGNVPVKL